MLELTIAICIVGSLILYAIMGGADFGGGMWDLLAFGPRAARQRQSIADAIGQVTLILVGWSLAQYPHLIVPDVTVSNACAPEITLRLLVLALGAGAIVLLPSLAFLFHLFKGKASH